VSSAAKEYFKKAELAAKKGNFQYAIELYTQGLIMDPSPAEPRKMLHRACTLAIEEQGGNAQGGLKAKFKLAPIQANIKKLSVQKKPEEIVNEYEKAIRIAPQDVRLLFGLAGALQQLEHEEAAISTLEEVLEFDKSNVEIYRKLGQLWSAKDEPEKSITYWEKVRQYKPDDKEAGKAIRDLAAASMVKKTEARKAESGDESFQAMLKDEEESAELEKKQKVLRTDEDFREAIKWKKDEIRQDPSNSRLWRDLASFYQSVREWKYAEAAYKKALEVNPHDMFVKEKMGQLRESRFQFEIETLKAKLEAAEQNGAGGNEELAKTIEAKEEAFREFRVVEYARRVKEQPTDQDLKIEYGQILMSAEKYDEAIAQYQQAVKDPKLRVKANLLIGNCWEGKKLYDLAEKQYVEALGGVANEDSEQGKRLKYHLGRVAEAKDSKENALKWYQELMAIDIGYMDVSARVAALMS